MGIADYYLLKKRINSKLGKVNKDLGRVEEIVQEDWEKVLAEATIGSKKELPSEKIEEIKNRYFQSLITLKRNILKTAKKRLETFSEILDEYYVIRMIHKFNYIFSGRQTD